MSKEKIVNQSSTFNNQSASFATDTDMNTVAKTQEEHNPWWEIDLGGYYKVEQIDLSGFAGLEDYYIFLSIDSIVEEEISEIVANSDISRVFVEKSKEGIVEVNRSGRFLRIQKNGLSELEIQNVLIWGFFGELCGNGNDDDNDGAIDCDDTDCKGDIINVAIVQEPSCNICTDGVLSVQEGTLRSSNREISLDGGVTFVPMPNSYQKFYGLLPDDYSIIIRNKLFGCLTPWGGGSIELRAPLGQPLGHCENGDLESGDFTGWRGYTTLWVKEAGTPVPPYVGDFEEGFVDTRHRIVSNGVDNFAPSIHYPFSGSYCFLLGNNDNGYNIDKTTYSFVVDDDNKDFTFNYAPVLQDPDHEDFKPYFEYAFYYMDGGAKHLVPNSNFKVIADRDDPYWTAGYAGTVYKGWSCVNIDLSQYVGKEVLVEFIVADCGYNEHFGYVYIDGLCVSPDDNKPVPSLVFNDVICESQEVFIDATESYSFNKYDLEIAELDADGNKVDVVQVTRFSSYISILDVKELFEINSKELECGKDYLVSLTLYNDCSVPESIERSFRYECGGGSIAYKDFLMCNSDPTYNIPIEGDVNCASCDYKWNPSSKLQNSSSAFPIISRDTDWDAYQHDYTVEVTDDLGCIYRDTVEFYNLPELEIEPFGVCVDKLKAFLIAEKEILTIDDIYEVSFYTEAVNGQLSELSTTKLGYYYNPDRTGYRYRLSPNHLEVGESIIGKVAWADDIVNNTDEFSLIAPNACPATKVVKTVTESTFATGDFKFWVPPNFSPNDDGINDTWGPYAPVHGNITFATFQVFDGDSKGMFFEKILDSDPIGRVDVNEIRWDGTHKDGKLVPKVLVWQLILKNCDHLDEQVFSGDVTIIR